MTALARSIDPESLDEAATHALDAWDALAPLLKLSPAQKQVSRATKAAIILQLSIPGVSTREAAQALGLTPKGFQNAIAKVHVQSLKNQIAKALRESWAEQAVATFAEIMIQEKKASDRMRAAEFIAGIEGIAPTKRQEIQHHNAPQTLGIMIVDPRKLDAVEGGSPMIDVTPKEADKA